MRRLFLVFALGAGAAFACSSSDDETPATAPDGGTSTLPPSDAAIPEDAADASKADVVDAGPQICSTDHFCHSEVPKGQFLRNAWGDGTGVLWAVALEGDLLRWDGSAWKVHAHLTDNEGGLTSIYGAGPTDIWITSDKGLLHGTGASSETLTFAPVAAPGDATIVLKSVWGTGPTDIWAVGGIEDFENDATKGRVVHYNGTTWALDATLTAKPINYGNVFGSATGGVWMQGEELVDYTPNARIMHRATPTSAWTTSTLEASPRELIAFGLSSDTSIWLGGSDGDFNTSSWHGTQAADGGFDFTYDDRGYFARPIFAYWGVAANDTWAVGQQGYVAHWNGTSWQPAITHVGSQPIGDSIWAIWGTSNDDFWVVGDEIALHKTLAGKP